MAGLNTSNTAVPLPFPNSTVGYDSVSAASCANGRAARGADEAGIISVGQTPSLSSTGYSACGPPMPWLLNPLGGKTIDWKAGCGKSARPVWREGEPNSIGSPYPDLCWVTLLMLALPNRNSGRLTVTIYCAGCDILEL